MPNRIIKDSIRTSRKVNNLNDFQFRVWVHLITYVDDYGRGSADPELLKGLVFPRRRDVTQLALSETLCALAGNGLIVLYEVDGESYFYFPSWSEHQRIQSKRSKFPEPPCPTVRHGEAPPNPIQSNPNQSESESETESETRRKKRAREEKGGDFEAFWTAYPRKTGSIDRAYREYLEALKTDVKPEALLEALRGQAEEWREIGEPRFIPSAEKWLHNRGWEQKRAPPRKKAPNPLSDAAVLDRTLAALEKI